MQGEQAAELAGVAVTFHYLNRMVKVFLGASPLPPAVPGALGGPLMRILSRIVLSAQPARTAQPAWTAQPARTAQRAWPAHDLLPAGEPLVDQGWLAGSPRIADAFARARAAIERAGVDAVPERVRELTLAELAGWDGTARGPSRAWADAAVSGLAAADRPAGRLALLTAFASYQVLADDIAEFRHGNPDDGALIGLTSWASLAAALRIGSWLGTGQAAGIGQVAGIGQAAGHRADHETGTISRTAIRK
jgi:hypothetical protein